MNRLIEKDIQTACEVLRKGGVILYPTDTVWGIGCDATCAEAVARIYEIKKRSDSKSLLVLLDSATKLDFYINDLPNIALDLIEVSDQPLTIVYSGAKNVAPNLIAGDGTLGIRITNEAFSRELCRRFGKPLVSTSANISGQPAPENFAKINDEIIRSVDYTVNYRRNDNRIARPSAIIKIGPGGEVQIIRE
ncbi:MAG: threonylcarbamoyl-AMP synthase [Dysgonamonadaceae bacterium]|jgi:L-threonylcarbamoyladenylate synthase|nr:threonylcarbamoyl-AMP synthase [Dysgonamonadaceae bacterium]